MTASETNVEISGTQVTGWPPLRKGSSFSCRAWKMSFTPMKARMNASPCLRNTRRSMSPPSRK